MRVQEECHVMNVCRYWTMITLCTMSAMVSGIPFSQTAQAQQEMQATHIEHIAHKTVKIDGVEIFYREAGPQHAPAVLLLHGFPSSSFMFRHLMPALADRYHVVAP